MRTSRFSRRGLAGVALAVALVVSTAACGGDDKSDSSSVTSRSQSTFCTTAKRVQDAPAAERAEQLAADAPAEIKPEMETIKKMIDLQHDPKADEIQKAEAATAAANALPKVVTYLKEQCGLTIDYSAATP